MQKEKILEELLNLLERLSFTVKYDRGNFRGGLVHYHDHSYFYLNRRSETEAKINIIIDELKQLEIPEEILTVEIKEILYKSC